MKEFEMNNKKLEISQNSEQKKAVQGEHEALSRLAEAEFQTGEFLEDRRNQILSEGKSEMLMHESRAERSAHAIRELGRQLPGSMQVRKLNEMVVLKLFMKWRS